MSLRRILIRIAELVADEADQNERFRMALEREIGVRGISSGSHSTHSESGKRKGGRRTPAILDPIEIAIAGESALRSRLQELTLEQLRDVVAQFRMDPGKLVMKWKDPHRVIDRIVEMSLARAAKGEAFRAD